MSLSLQRGLSTIQGPQILSISYSFWGNLAPPPRGNPGSATEIDYIIESTCSIEINLCKFGQIKLDLFQLNKYDY